MKNGDLFRNVNGGPIFLTISITKSEHIYFDFNTGNTIKIGIGELGARLSIFKVMEND